MTGSPALLTINLRREWAPGRADIEWRDRVAEALVCARQLAWSVLHCFEAGLATPEIRGALPGLEPLAVEAIHRFSGASPLDNRAVADALTGTQTIYVVGIVTARTMLATALTASERSWRVRFIAEACRDLSPGSQASIGDRADLVQRVSMQTAFRSSSGNVIELHKWRVEGGSGAMSINMATPAETQDLRLLAALLSAALDETGRVGAPDEVTDKLLDALRWVADTDTSLFIEPPQH